MEEETKRSAVNTKATDKRSDSICQDDPDALVHPAAVMWCCKAADQGFANAQYNLGVCLRDGIGEDKDKHAAVMWHRKAADQGHATAQSNLGLCYTNGTGVD